MPDVKAKEKFSFSQFIVPHFAKKFTLMMTAIILMGFFLSFLIEIGWGTDPATFMNLNIAHALGWTLGNWQLTINVGMLALVFVFLPKLIGFGTIANMVLIGYTADFFCWLWRTTGVAASISGASLCPKIIFFALSIICFVIVAAVYMNAQMGLSPYDGTPKLMELVLPFLPAFVVRMIFDFLVILVGYIASRFSPDGMQGSLIGVTAMAFLLGPVITVTGRFMNKYVLNFDD